MDFDAAFVDFDFRVVPEWRRGDLGPRPGGALYGFGTYENAVPPIPSSQWPELVRAMEADGGGAVRLVTRIYDQDGEGSCVANATCQAHEIVQARTVGKHRVIPLSAISLYKRIGRSPNSGSMLDDALDELSRRGALPLNTEENRHRFVATMPNVGFYTKWPERWEDVARQFRCQETYVVRTLEGLVTALLRQEPVVVGRSGHSICYCGLTYKDGQLYAIYANSWGRWGFGAGDFQYGFGADSMRMMRASAGWAFVIRTVYTPELS